MAHSRTTKEENIGKLLKGVIESGELVAGNRGEKLIALHKSMEFIFQLHQNNDLNGMEAAMNQGIELFQELYPGTTPSDFAKFIVFRKVNNKLAEEILGDGETSEQLQDILLYNMDMLK